MTTDKKFLILEGEYADIIIELLRDPFLIDSISKLIFIAFCVKNEKRIRAYSNKKRDFVNFFFDNIKFKFISHKNEIKAILEVIYKLVSSNWISIDGDKIKILKDLTTFNETCNKFLIATKKNEFNAINEINKLDVKAFLEEVIQRV